MMFALGVVVGIVIGIVATLAWLLGESTQHGPMF